MVNNNVTTNIVSVTIYSFPNLAEEIEELFLAVIKKIGEKRKEK